MLGFDNSFFSRPAIRAFVPRVLFPWEQIAVEFCVKPVKKTVRILIIQQTLSRDE